ncbi:hypothetical protein CALVIDRAFT_497521 [Calocera viscosa TUFC12733]|uniref:EKC/KEOPS complex subunit BUD32 n=1 Tax=Calocera viscosa (strain TUFC12733) TaxID=1330018 RepID=A0A167N1J8_CALVF|nr:hypothetical protein CALVIDRAFT_497521 [Calocera viscosa TUFC12733]
MSANGRPSKGPSPTLKLIESSTLIQQGAEAKVYLSPPFPEPMLLKHRFPKSYRHPTLDAQITRTRVQMEARALVRCQRAGVRVPGVRLVDAPVGVLGVEWVEGKSVRKVLGGGAEEEGEEEDVEQLEEEAEELLREFGITRDEIMRLIGLEISKMHRADIVHGDLTTSNMMLRRLPAPSTSSEIVLIDFGLSGTSSLVEDKAVDLYVLERAFASTHPDSESLFGDVLEAYARGMGRAWEPIYKRLEEVRLRGRKRSMVG